MPDYQQMYFKLVRAVRDAQECCEQAEQILIDAMQACEELYISEPACRIFPFSKPEPDAEDPSRT